ncbi:MAG: hypothetical protein K2O29_02785 [Ruminococcus sp.]|nr:hypothetical protein [Ruminococcus sp.]MDE7137372.1 hypothetical protein [Ruminococcus sp.]
MNIFCIPCAGGSAYMFRKIEGLLPSDAVIIPLEIAGRGSRFNEKLNQCIEETANDLYNSIKDRTDSDYCILGFSMGGIIAYELCRKIYDNGLKMPISVFMLGTEPPEFFSRTEYHKLSDSDFRKKMISINGIPEELVQNSELFDVYLPALKADFKMCETYRKKDDTVRFDVNFHLINGIKDSISIEQLELWKNYCRKYTMDFVPGNHFFINSNLTETALAISKNLVCL